MDKRLIEIIRYITGGRQKDFADIMGWSPQYLHKLINGGGIGIQPVISILKKFPEIEARWFILGEGTMITSCTEGVKSQLLKLLELEKYIPVMTTDELRELSGGKTDFDADTLEHWDEMLSNKKAATDAHFREAYKKQEELCK